MSNKISKLLTIVMTSLIFISLVNAGNATINVTEKTITVNDTLIAPPEDPGTKFWFETYKLINIIPGDESVTLECNNHLGSCGTSVRMAMEMLSNL